MDDKTILLTVLSQDGFGIKPTKQELILNLVKNYGIKQNVAEQLVFTCLRQRLIIMDSMVHRIGITQKGIDWLKNMEYALDEASHLPDEPLISKEKSSVNWNRRGAIYTLVVGLIGILVAIILAKCPSSNDAQHNQDTTKQYNYDKK